MQGLGDSLFEEILFPFFVSLFLTPLEQGLDLIDPRLKGKVC
jgi:hypothetical protein